MEKAYNIVTLGLVGITALSGIALSSSTAMADTNSNSATSTASVTVSETCSMTGTVNAPHTATVVNGTYTDNIGKTTLQAFCNDNAGFSIYAIGYTDDELGNNVMAGTNTGQDYAIATGTEQDGDDSNWAMKVTVADDGYDQGNLTIEDGFDDFSDVPDSYTKVASYPAITDQSLGAQLNTTYAVYVGPTQAADTYAGQVKYVLVHPSGAPAPSLLSLSDITTMQEMTPEICANSSINDTKQLRDIRDNKLYWVTKLADNNCWMTQNLDLDLNSSVALTSANTDLNTKSSWRPDRSTVTNVSQWTLSDDEAASYDPGDMCIYVPYDEWGDQYNDERDIHICVNEEEKHSHQGNAYNYAAATAGSYDNMMYLYEGICSTAGGSLLKDSDWWYCEVGEELLYFGDIVNFLEEFGISSETTLELLASNGLLTDDEVSAIVAVTSEYSDMIAALADGYGESPSYIMNSILMSLVVGKNYAKDSICPAGWQLPYGSAPKTVDEIMTIDPYLNYMVDKGMNVYLDLAGSGYGQAPVYMSMGAYVYDHGGGVMENRYSTLWTNTLHGFGAAGGVDEEEGYSPGHNHDHYPHNIIGFDVMGDSFDTGGSIRCVAR